MENKGVVIDNTVENQVKKLEKEGKTVMYLSDEKHILAIISIADTLRLSAEPTMVKLKNLKIGVWMVTGDNKSTAGAIAKKVGIDNVMANVLPANKEQKVREIQKSLLLNDRSSKVAFVGDGINDAPALAASDVGIALSTGTDVAIESASVTIMNKDLLNVYKTILLSKKTVKIIKQNLLWAFGYNVILIPIAMGILYPISHTLLNPEIAAFAMAASSVSVLTNSLRLRSVKL